MNNSKFSKRNLLVILKNNKYFFVFLAFYSIYNLIFSIMIDFESIIFLPFRYEGLLFFKNAIMNDSNAFFFIRDWSTSFLSEEHPLLYFHNLDLVHFFAGFIQYYLPYPKIALFILSLFLSATGLYIAWINLKRTYGVLFTTVFVGLLFLPIKAYLFAPQNLFSAVTLLCIVWNFVILKRIWVCKTVHCELAIQLFFSFLLAAITETNLFLLLFIVTSLLTVCSHSSWFYLKSYIRTATIILISGLPIIILRSTQFIAVLCYGYRNEYIDDLRFTSKLKIQSDIQLPDAIEFYADRGITFFGQAEPQTIISNVKELFAIYTHQYNLYSLTIMLLISCLIILASKFSYSQAMNKTKLVNPDLMCKTSFLCSYLFFFFVAAFGILPLTGDASIKISMASHGFFDFTLIFRAIYIILIPWLVLNIIKMYDVHYPPLNVNIIPPVLLVLFAYLSYPSFVESKKENFSYKKAIKYIPPNVDVITNFEPSIVAVETGSRVSMGWYAGQPDSCDFMNSKRLLKMFKTNKNHKENNGDLYVFMVFYYPYGVNRIILEDRLCVTQNNFSLIYVDSQCAVYKLKK